MAPKKFNELPEEVASFLSDAAGFDEAKMLVAKYGLEDDAVPAVMALVEEIATGVARLDQLPDLLVQEAGVPEEKKKQAAIDLASTRLMPIARVVGDVKGAVIRWGGKVEEIAAGVPHSMGAESFAEDALQGSGIRMSDPVMQNRLRLIIISYLKGVRARPETLSVLSRAKKVGGAELATADAEALLGLIDGRIATEKISFDEEPVVIEKPAAKVAVRVEKTVAPVPKLEPVAPSPAPVAPPTPVVPAPKPAPVPVSIPVTKAKPVPAPAPKPTPVPVAPAMPMPKPAVSQKRSLDSAPSDGAPLGMTQKKDVSFRPTEGSGGISGSEADIFSDADAKEIQKIAATKPVAAAKPPDADPLVQSIVDATKFAFTNAEERERFSRIVDARVRDIRDAYETRRQLELPAARGGMGLAGARVAEVSEAMERLVGERQRALEAKAKAEREQAIAAKRAETATRVQTETAQEQDALAQRYTALTGKTPTPPNLPSGRGGSETNVPRPKGDARGLAVHPSLARQETQVDVQKMKAAAKPALSVGSIPPSAGRPQVQDVRFRPRLAGPMEELKGMTLIDLRRLSSDPAQATTKIRAKFALLEEQGYDRRLAALEAWKESPVNRQYLDLTREAIQKGKSIAAIAQEKAKSGEPALTSEEIAALRALNAELRF